jgi:methyltransferase of FxLD system
MARSVSERLRRSLVAELRAKGVVSSERVAAAFLSVPRERFLPDVLAREGLKAVYRDEAIVTKKDARGLPLSSSSQPAIMAKMLELLDPQPGHRVLEIGAGTGYNAALLAHIVGSRGRVTSIDIDPELARQARRSLRDAGVRATIVVGDGRQGHPPNAPYDRLIATAGADEIPRAWLEQVAEGGRLELPLRLDPERGAIQLIPVLERHGGRLRSIGLTWGGFMPLHGGDGGWRPPPATLSAFHSIRGQHTGLASINGEGLEHLSRSAARRLLASLLTESGPPRRHGMTGLDSNRAPMLLLYLLLNIPAKRRVSFSQAGRVGIGIVHRRSQSVAIVSVRSPWRSGDQEDARRARWRVNAYGADTAATELDELIDQWRELERTGRTKLRITGEGRARALRLTFAWTQNYA